MDCKYGVVVVVINYDIYILNYIPVLIIIMDFNAHTDFPPIRPSRKEMSQTLCS